MMEKNTMTENDKLQMFEDRPIRTAWDETQEEWYFSVVDVVAVLTEQTDNRRAAKYWSVLKTRLKNEGSELTTNCSQLKMKAADGKRRLTDVANTEQLLRIIQSVPSKKAEPFKMWLAMVGRERIEEIIDPELTIERFAQQTESKKRSGWHLTIFPGVDQSASANHPCPKRTDRCMEGARRERGAGVCHSDGRSDQSMVWHEHAAV